MDVLTLASILNEESARNPMIEAYEAIAEGRVEELEGLLKAFRFHESQLNSLLIDASRPSTKNGVQAVRLLISKGADPKCKDRGGRSPLHFASHGSDPKVAAELVDAGADPSVSDPMGWTPLHFAASSEFTARHEIARKLLEAGAEVNALTDDGYSPLHMAVSNSDRRMVVVLLEGGADPKVSKSSSSFTPIDIAIASGDRSIISAFEGLAVDPNVDSDRATTFVDRIHRRAQKALQA